MNETLQKMIEESGAMWEEVRDRTIPANEVVVAFSEQVGHRLSLEKGAHHPYWTVRFVDHEPDERADFLKQFGEQWPLLLGARISFNDHSKPIRGFVKNGRMEGWNISLDMNC